MLCLREEERQKKLPENMIFPRGKYNGVVLYGTCIIYIYFLIFFFHLCLDTAEWWEGEIHGWNTKIYKPKTAGNLVVL